MTALRNLTNVIKYTLYSYIFSYVGLTGLRLMSLSCCSTLHNAWLNAYFSGVKLRNQSRDGLLARSCDGKCGGRDISLNSQELEVGRLPVPGQPEIHSKHFSEKRRKNVHFMCISAFKSWEGVSVPWSWITCSWLCDTVLKPMQVLWKSSKSS